jgi:hypothetical protein
MLYFVFASTRGDRRREGEPTGPTFDRGPSFNSVATRGARRRRGVCTSWRINDSTNKSPGGGGSTGVRPAGLGNATCRAIRSRPSIGENLVKISLLDHKILENRVTLRENVGRRRGWNIVVHGVGGGGNGGFTRQSNDRAWVDEFWGGERIE